MTRIALDGTEQFYSTTEARLSGYGEIRLSKNLFAISECLGGDEFRGRMERALAKGPVDLEIGWRGDYGDPRRELRIPYCNRAMAVCRCSSNAKRR